MPSNKKIKKEKKIKIIQYRTLEERKNEIKEILNHLNEFELNPKYEPIKKLYKLFKQYIDTGQRLVINIPFPMINRRIKGILANSIHEEVSIVLIQEKF